MCVRACIFQWSPLNLPANLEETPFNSATCLCVHLNEVYAVFNTRTGVHLFKYRVPESWTELTVPTNINECYGMVSGDGNLYMVYGGRKGQVHVTKSVDGASWLVSTDCPRQQHLPAVVYEAGSVHLIGGYTGVYETVAWSSSVTADLQRWTWSDEAHDPVEDDEPGDQVEGGYFPTAPCATSLPVVIKHLDSWFFSIGYTKGFCTSPVYQLQVSGGKRTWEKMDLRKIYKTAGCASHLGWLVFAGGWRDRDTLYDGVYASCIGSNWVINLPSLPSGRHGARLVVFNGALMAYGGRDQVNFCSDIVTLDLSEWNVCFACYCLALQ